jgi:hypothetical protein
LNNLFSKHISNPSLSNLFSKHISNPSLSNLLLWQNQPFYNNGPTRQATLGEQWMMVRTSGGQEQNGNYAD